jgi:hypothetical protein
MSTLPQPPSANPWSHDDTGDQTGDEHVDHRADGWAPDEPTLRPGDLTATWRFIFLAAWVGVLLGFASVWKSSRTLGLSTWWLGAPAEPRFLLIQLLPFVAPVALIIAASKRVRFLPVWGTLGGLVMLGIAAGDISRFSGLATIQLVLAGAGLLVSEASFAGMMRRPR